MLPYSFSMSVIPIGEGSEILWGLVLLPVAMSMIIGVVFYLRRVRYKN